MVTRVSRLVQVLSLLLLPTTVFAEPDVDPDAGRTFLEENARRDLVTVLPSGLQYEVLRSAADRDGKSPGKNDECVCDYSGRLAVTGELFDTTEGKAPATFTPSQVIAGWTEALQLMRPGDKWKLYVPSDLAYGKRGAGKKVPPDAVLVFDLELLEVKALAGLRGMVSSIPVIGILAQSIAPGSSMTYGHVLFLVVALFYWTASKRKSGPARKVAARHVLVKTRELATAIKQKITEGAMSFGEAAAKHSICPSKKQGGFLGEFTQGQMVPAFDQICWVAPVKELQGPVQTQFGFHLIEVVKRDPLPEPEFAGPKPLEVEYKPSAGTKKNK
jgi:hypothetical protein